MSNSADQHEFTVGSMPAEPMAMPNIFTATANGVEYGLHLDVIVRQGDGWQACKRRARQVEVGREGGGALQLKGVGACQGGLEEEGQWTCLLRQQCPKAIPRGDAHPLG